MLRMKWTKLALAATMAITLAGEPQSAHAFEPLTALAVKVGTSLVVKGFNFLLGRATQGPDVHFETTKQIHGELRAVREDVLQNRALQIDLHEHATIHREEIEELVISVGEGVKEHGERTAEMERIIAVLGTTEKLLRTTATARKAKNKGKMEEHAHTLETLREDLSRIEREGIILDFSEHLRPVAVLPRIGAIQARWTALQAMPAMDITRADFVRRAGNWLESQRHPTGETDPVKQTLADLITGMEHHAQGLARYLAELGRPCSPLWSAYLTVETYKEYDQNMIKVSKIGVSQAQLKAVQGSGRKQVDGDVHYADSPLVQPTKLVWSKEIVSLDRPHRLRTGASIRRKLSSIHRRAFECEGPLSASARTRLANKIPDVPGKRAGTGAGQVPTIEYDQGPLALEELVTRGSCGEEKDCRTHWERVHMRLEAAKTLLMGLYAIRNEVNRTLEWLAAETIQAECTYWRDEPRVCVFGDEAVSAEVQAATERPRTEPTEPRLTVSAYQTARDWSARLNEEQVGALRYDRTHASQARAKAIGRMYADLVDQVNEIQRAQALNDQRLDDVAAEAARMAWVRLAVSVVQDQITELVEAAAEEAITAALTDDETGSATANEWTAIVVESPSEPAGESQNDGSGGDSDPGAATMAASTEKQPALIAMAPPHAEGAPHKGVIANNYAESVYGHKSGLSKMQQVALWLPEINPEVTDTLAGMGDGMTLGVTRHVREWVGLSAEVDTTSGEYRGGTLIGWLAPGTAGVKAGPGAMKVIQQLIRTGKGSVKVGGYSVLMKVGHGQRTQGISLIRHTVRGQSNRLLSFDVVTKLKGPGSLASKLPHLHIGRYKAHLPWEPAWLVPTVIGIQTPKAH